VPPCAGLTGDSSQAVNLSLALFGLYVLNSGLARLMCWYLGLLALSMLPDIIFLGVFGTWAFQGNAQYSSSESQTNVFAMVMEIFNMFVKAALIFFGYQLYQLWGGSAAASVPPVAGGSSGGPMPSGDAYSNMGSGGAAGYAMPAADPAAYAPSGYSAGTGYVPGHPAGGYGYSHGGGDEGDVTSYQGTKGV
jgi:hypothetical protein